MNVVKLGAALITRCDPGFRGITVPEETNIIESACVERRGDQ